MLEKDVVPLLSRAPGDTQRELDELALDDEVRDDTDDQKRRETAERVREDGERGPPVRETFEQGVHGIILEKLAARPSVAGLDEDYEGCGEDVGWTDLGVQSIQKIRRSRQGES